MSAAAAAWLQHAAEGIASAVDPYDLIIDGEEWYAERTVRDDEDTADQLLLITDDGRSARVRVSVEIIEGAVT